MSSILNVKDLKTSFFTHAGEVKAVRGIDLNLDKGETIGLVGESGCGKSVSMLSLMRILPDAGKIISGEVTFDSQVITNLKERQMQKIRGNSMGMIFQDPMTSLNPVYTVGNQMAEHLRRHQKMGKEEARKKALAMLNLVGISNARERLKQYPHEFSGGMRQRVMIAMTLVTEPKLLIADEPTTALDVTIQAQILRIMKDINTRLHTSIILITHDLGIVADACDRVYVMYGGLIVETGKKEDIYYQPKHPYTWGLLNSVPNPESKQKEKLQLIEGQPPDLIQPPKGCPFAARCKFAMKICAEKHPGFYELNPHHKVACWLADPQAPETKLE